MKKLKIGDKVRIKEDLKAGKKYGGLTLFGGAMSDCLCQICTIRCEIEGNYCVEENPFIWARKMLEKVAD